MRTHPKLVGLSALAIVATLCLPADGRAAIPAHAKAVTHGLSPFSSQIRLLAGSSSSLVYSVNPVHAAGDVNSLAGRLYLFTSPGNPGKALPGSVTDFGYSIAKNLLTAQRDPNHIDWWNLATNAHGTAGIGTSTVYLGAAPNGFLYEGGDGTTAFLRPLSGGASQDLGQPFAGDGGDAIVEAVTSERGVAYVGNQGHVVFASWSTPSLYTTVLVGSDQIDYCYSMESFAIGCTGAGTSGEDVVRLNTDGSTAPIVTHGQTAPGSVSVAVTSTGWLDQSSNSLHSAPSDHAGPVATFSKPVSQLLPAYGGLIFTPGVSATPAMYASSDARDASIPALYLKAGTAAAAASAVSLTSGRIGYGADEGRPMAVWSRTLSGSTGLGAESLLVQHATETGLSLSGAATVATIGSHHTSNAHYWAHNPLRTTELGKAGSADGSAQPVASGNRVLYVTNDPSTSKRKALIYDFGTGKSMVVPNVDLTNGEQAVALWGSYVAYAKADGSIWRVNLDRHVKPQKVRGRLTTAQRHHGDWGVSVHESGDVVGWTYGLLSRQLTGFRNMAGHHRAVSLGQRFLVGLTDAGALTLRFVANQLRYELRSYTSKSTRTLLTDTNSVPISVADGRIAWVTDAGVAMVAKLPGRHVKEQPRYLGDAAAKRRRSKITLLIPTSAPLTKCHVTVNGKKAKCSKRYAALGDAFVQFHGGAASYHWSLKAQGVDGAVLRADGQARKVKGTVQVK